MFFKNDVPNHEGSFIRSHESVLSQFEDTILKHTRMIGENIRRMTDKVRQGISPDYENSPVPHENRDLDAIALDRARPSSDVESYFLSSIAKATRYYDRRVKQDASLLEGRMSYRGISVVGALDRGDNRDSIKLEMDELYYMNDVLGRKVFNIDKLVYVSFFFGGLNTSDSWENPVRITYDPSYIVEIDALLIRYASTLDADALRALCESVCVMITDRVYMMEASRPLIADFMKTYVPDMMASCMGLREVNESRIPPDVLYKIVLIAKVVSDSVNGLNTNNDTKEMDDIINLGCMALKNAGSIAALSNVSNILFSKLNKIKGKERYLNIYLDSIVNFVDAQKSNIYSDMARTGHFSYNVKTFSLAKAANYNVPGTFVPGAESIVMPFIEMAIGMEKDMNSTPALFSIIGMESADATNEVFRAKLRGELLRAITEKERMKYNKYESEVSRYRSDAINAKDESKKNSLLYRSKGIGKIIAIEMSRSGATETYISLLTMLDDTRYEIDVMLSNRDFNRERNTRMYGQIVPSGDWDY